MIDTFIFDIGNVLVQFNWRETFSKIFDKETSDIIAKATVENEECWRELDKGVKTYGELIEMFVNNAGGYEKEIRYAIDSIYENLYIYPYASSWLKELKEKGYKIYILSNFGDYTFNYAKKYFDFLKYADGSLISYEVKMLKPSFEIYEALCDKFGIIKENAVFLDDSEMNIVGAKAFGLNGIVFENYRQALNELALLDLKYEI
ncbi:MAG: HAD family phosphatase [Ruminococcaceae bacterium]|nr:HAD family phosphatase [Oscillospiraceae bacterium]